MNKNTQKIRDLNDEARYTLLGCKLFVTSGVQELGHAPELLNIIREYSDFSKDSDPYGEHDFGVFEFSGKKLYWKFDYYDKNMEFASPDPSNPDVTERVLTIMLADER